MIEAVEDVRQLVGRDSDSMIFHRNGKPILSFLKSISTLPPCGLNLMALSTRAVSARSSDLDRR